MTKAELIKKYGIEWYEARNIKNNARNKARYHKDPEYRDTRNAKNREHMNTRYHNDDEYREHHIAKGCARSRRSYCKDGQIELIENYELAKTDNFNGWDIHHRLELTLDGEYAHSAEDLKRMNMYYNRPYFELIFLRHGEHIKLHNLNKRG